MRVPKAALVEAERLESATDTKKPSKNHGSENPSQQENIY